MPQPGAGRMILRAPHAPHAPRAPAIFAWLWVWLVCVMPQRAEANEDDAHIRVPTDQRVRYDVEASADRGNASVTTRGRISLPAAQGEEVKLWLYGDRTSRLPPSLTDLNVERLFPGGYSRGGFGIVTTRVEGCAPKAWPIEPHGDAVRGRLLRVSICAGARRPLVISFDATLHVPRRYGTLGVTSDAMMLGDPWYPLVMSDENVPARGDHHVDVTWSDGALVSPRGVERRGPARIEGEGVSHVPVSLVDDPHVHDEVYAGVQITLVSKRALTRDAESEGPTPEGFVMRDPWDIDATAATLDATRKCIELLRRLGFVAGSDARGRAMAKRIVIVEAPERERLATTLPGLLVVSDRAFRLLPLAPVQRFHALAIARRVFAALLSPRIEAREPLVDRTWVADADGSLLVDLMLALESGGRDRPQDLIGFAGFHPAVDNLLYAPKVAFRSAYFHDVAERDPDRDGADRAFNDLPFGHLVLEKLRDRIGPPLGKAVERHLLEGVPFRDAVAGATERDLTRFYRTWLGPTPRLAYRIVAHESAPWANAHRHVVTLERLGATWVEEPVVVELVDKSGVRERKIWDAPGARGVVTWTSNAPLADATLDPEGRLVQDPSLTPDHPRFDDEIKHAWRPPIFSSFAVTLSVAEKRPDALIDFVLKRRYDVRQWFGVSASTAARGYGGRLRYGRGFGPKRDLNSTLGAATIGASALRSDNGFGGSNVAVTEVDLSATIAWDTRLEFMNPRHGWGVAASISGGAAREDGTRDTHPSASLAVRGEAVHAFHPRHVLAGAVGAGGTICPALAQQLQGLSGRRVLRAYAADELIGCAASYAIAEYRITPFDGVYWNAAHLAWFKGLQLVPFAAGGLLSSRRDLLFERFYGEVGFGTRALVDWGGVQPGVFAADLGIPLSRTQDTYTDADGLLRRRPSYGLYVAFEQAF